MAISELVAIVAPPQHPLEAGPKEQWEAIQQSLGTGLPADLRDFGLTYGTGEFADQGIRIFNPFAAVFPLQMKYMLDDWRAVKSGDDNEVPFEIYPDVPGLLPWGCDENATGMFWYTEGKPDEWPILLRGHEEVIYQRFEMQLTTFLSKVIKLEIPLSGIWPCEMFQDSSRLVFQPLELEAKERFPWPGD